jgi:hypothetical protein
MPQSKGIYDAALCAILANLNTAFKIDHFSANVERNRIEVPPANSGLCQWSPGAARDRDIPLAGDLVG